MILLPVVLLFATVVYGQQVDSRLGTRQQQAQWRAGHAAAYIDPYVIVYGGTEDVNADANSAQLTGSTGLWIWDSRNGAWYHPAQLDGAASNQVNFRATPIPSPGQMLAVVSNTSTTGKLQKLDTNNWSWSFPTASLDPPGNAAGFALSVVNNTMYMYGGLSVDQNGFPIQNAVLNSLFSMDANAYSWTSAPNGLGVTDHAMCYVQQCNCLISFGGTTTGSRADPIQDVMVYQLSTGVWTLRAVVQSVNNAVPGARRLHTANCLQDRMIIYGGGTDRPFDSDVWILDASNYPTLQWQKAPMTNLSQGPNVRMGHSAVLDPESQKIYIYGGWGVDATGDSDIYVLDTQAWAWTRVNATGLDAQPTTDGSAPQPTASSGIGGTADGNTTSEAKNNTAIIAGAVVGGIAAMVLAAAACCFFCVKRRRRKQQQQQQQQQRDLPTDEKTADDIESKVIVADKSITSLASPTTQTTSGSSAGAIPSLMLSELGSGATTRSSSQQDFRYQIPNEIATQKPNEFTRPLPQQRSITSSMLASTGLSPTSPSDQYTYTTTFRSSVSSSVPVAQAVNPIQTQSSANTTPLDLYDSVSPLEMLASLGRLEEEHDTDRLLPSKYGILPNAPIIGLTNSIIFATDEHQPVVVKSFGRREAWERECRALNKLKSDHVVQLYAVLNNTTAHLAILEQLDVTLQSVMKQQFLDYEMRHEIAKRITDNLAWAHSKDVAFCDLKPSNVMRSADGKWKLIDFEASRTIGQECVGLITPRYCPPEVARATTYGHEGVDGIVATASVDLWSLGCIIYELETREPLFAQTITDETVLHFVSHPSPLTPGLRNGLKWNEHVELEIPQFDQRVTDPDARDLIRALLRRDPVKRGSASYWMKQHPYFCA